ncbi:MAG: hypothetical protein P8H13_00170 [Polaribacter sp.]|nr:hypothetical protein [Polaribacter sp.]MDG1994296.1 hypothetical protein [Polaribacter sp.]
MEKITFQDFIGKNIKELNILHNVKTRHRHVMEKNKHYMSSEIPYYFYDKVYSKLKVSTDKHNIIQDITIYIHGLIDENFYNSFNNDYGIPDEILIEKDTTIINDNKLEGDISSRATSWLTTFKKGTFQENPLLIKWYKGKYQIVCFLKREINVTEIRFSIPRDDFK